MKENLSLSSFDKEAFLRNKSDLYDAPILFMSQDGKYVWGERAHSSFEKILLVEEGKIIILNAQKTADYISRQIYKVLNSST